MNLYSIYSFLRPTFYVLLSLGLLHVFLPKPSQQTTLAIPVLDDAIERTLATVEAVERPHPALTAQEVVQIQLNGLADEDSSRGILQCMTFASPDNRAITGPLVRFAEMVRSPPFDVLANPQTVLMGKKIQQDGLARILVTVVHEDQVHPFVWVLSQQSATPYAGCWMTDAVFPLSFEQASGLDFRDKPNSI